METIALETWIDAPIERCFLLSLSIDLHTHSARSSKEKAIAGVRSGLISEGETVTFSGTHFGLKLRHTSHIEALRPFSYFRDVMVAGVFEHFEHDHYFAVMDEGTRIRDEIRFQAPWGVLGRIASTLLVRRHVIAFLLQRNAILKQVAESEDWHQYLDGQPMSVALVREEAEGSKRWDRPGLQTRSQN